MSAGSAGFAFIEDRLADTLLYEKGLDEVLQEQAKRIIKETRELRKRCERLEAALCGLEELYARDGESNLDRFERVAEAFYRETGLMAPGKDVAAASSDSTSYEERRERWEAWYAQRAAAARLALRAGEQHEA